MERYEMCCWVGGLLGAVGVSTMASALFDHDNIGRESLAGAARHGTRPHSKPDTATGPWSPHFRNRSPSFSATSCRRPGSSLQSPVTLYSSFTRRATARRRSPYSSRVSFHGG